MNKVYIGVGGNQGDRLSILLDCLLKLKDLLEDLKYSSIWETKPMVLQNQPDFLNLVVSGDYTETPEKLLHSLWEIEKKAGRDRRYEVSKGPRPLDLDILLFGDIQMQSETLSIPHPAMLKRAFVLVPLTELNPDITIPGKTIFYKQYLPDVDNQGVICYKTPDEVTALLRGSE